MDATIRWADVADARAVAVVHVDTWRAAYRGLIEQSVLDGLDVVQRTQGWTRWIANSLAGEPTDRDSDISHRLLVAEVGERVVGWAGFGAGRDEGMHQLGELAGFYVHPDHWSRGVGHALLARVEHELRTAGWTDAYLWVLDGNRRAIRFYERHGWRADGTEKIGDAGGARQLHELRHSRRLSEPVDAPV